MKKQIVQTFIVLAGLAFFNNPSGATVVGSRHDFTSGDSNFIGESQEVCVYCHTPHGGFGQDRNGNRLPLWNRTLNEYTANYFTMYDSPTLDATMPADGKPTGTSLLCLSCHDGVSVLGNVKNPPYGIVSPINFNYSTMGAFDNTANLGQDLSNDHPISFEYTSGLVILDPKLQDPVNIDARLKLGGSLRNRLECTTCHDVHEYGLDPDGILEPKVPFLRMSNAGSAMCTSCHLI